LANSLTSRSLTTAVAASAALLAVSICFVSTGYAQESNTDNAEISASLTEEALIDRGNALLEAGDFAAAMNEFRAGYWFGETGGEALYSLAVQTGNLSAAQDFEAWQGRPPFIADDVDPGCNRSFAHVTGRRRRGRLAVGFSFPWQGHNVTVTSFSSDGRYLTACAYAKGDRRKVTRRFKITIAGIRADRRLRKERDDLYKRLRKLSLVDGKIIETFRERSGITSNEGWRMAPIEDIRTHVETLEQEHAQAA